MLRRRFDSPPRAHQLPLRLNPQARNQRRRVKRRRHKPQPRLVVDCLRSCLRHAQENVAGYFARVLPGVEFMENANESRDSELRFRLSGMVVVRNYDFALRVVS